MNIRRVIDSLACILLVLCICILPIYILITFQTNKNIVDQVNKINGLVMQLEENRKHNAELIFESLEFRRLEYKCYFSAESYIYNTAFLETMKKYTEYLNNDKTLTGDERKLCFNNLNILEETFNARILLFHKLLEYDNKRLSYMGQYKHKSDVIESTHKSECEKTDSEHKRINDILSPPKVVQEILKNPVPVDSSILRDK